MTEALAAEETYVPMIREGRVWEYVAQYWHPGENGLVYHLMRFNGTAEVNGEEYHYFELYKSRYHKDVTYEDGSYGYEFSKEEDRGYPKFLLREEPGKVYILTALPEEENDCEHIVHIKNDSELETVLENHSNKAYGEYLLYDFTLKEGDARMMPIWDDINLNIKYFALLKTPMTVGGESCRVMSFMFSDEDESFKSEWSQSDGNVVFKMIEGIGIDRNGCLPRFCTSLLAAMFQDESYLPDDGSFLSCVYDSEGKIIYPMSHVGIDNITDTQDSAPQSGVIYDLMGRRVERVQPGSVYVRDGKKFVGR